VSFLATTDRSSLNRNVLEIANGCQRLVAQLNYLEKQRKWTLYEWGSSQARLKIKTNLKTNYSIAAHVWLAWSLERLVRTRVIVGKRKTTRIKKKTLINFKSIAAIKRKGTKSLEGREVGARQKHKTTSDLVFTANNNKKHLSSKVSHIAGVTTERTEGS